MVGRRSVGVLFASMLLLGSVSCFDNNEAPRDKVDIKGTVLSPAVGIGCANWGIRSEDGTRYEIRNLPDDFRSPGLVVVAHLQLRRDMVSTCMAGPIAEVIAIERGA